MKPAKAIKWILAGMAASAAVTCLLLCFALFFSSKPPLPSHADFGKIVLDAKGNILRLSLSDDQKYRFRTTLDKIAPEAVAAVLTYEDRHFHLHPGVNPVSVIRAFFSSLVGRKVGASTITMQTARLLFKLKTSTITGKLKQMWFALVLERHYSKAEILETYFNLAPYGGNIEGIEAAARIFFHKPASSLSQLEAVALAVVPQNPSARKPGLGGKFDAARLRLGSAFTLNSGSEAPLAVHGPAKIPFKAPHLATELIQIQPQGVIHAFIQGDLQRLVENSLTNFTNMGGRYGLSNAAAIIVDCATMGVAALAGSSDFHNDEIGGQIDGTSARRSPGSTLKPFIYALALDQGIIHPATILPDSPRSFGGYDPENFDKGFRGPVSAADALLSSRNLPAIRLAEQLSSPDLYDFLKTANVDFKKGKEHYGLAMTLGGAEVTMRELAALYAMLANQGIWQPLRLAKEQPPAPAKRLLSPEAAWLTLWMLENGATGPGGRPLPAKTGTSNGLRDAWTCGVIGNYVLIVWVGNFDNSSNPLFVGAKTARPLFEEIAAKLAAARPMTESRSEPPARLNLQEADVCVPTGDLDIAHCSWPGKTWIIPGKSPTRDSGILRPVLIDNATGLRACREEAGKTREVWMEFWPTQMAGIFAAAGINKPLPPDWLEECRPGQREDARAGAPEIILPKKNVAYVRRLADPAWKLPLQASCDAEASLVHWFADSSYIGSSLPGETFFWESPQAGSIEIGVMDNLGRGRKQKCLIELAP